MNPHTNKAATYHADRVCDFLNQRFGYRYSLELALASIGIKKDMVAVMSGLARNRNIEAFVDLLRMHDKSGSPKREGE